MEASPATFNRLLVHQIKTNMDTELCTLRSRFINVYDTDELKSKLQDILPFDKKGYKVSRVC